MNLLVPFPATVATRVKKIASMNGLPATLVARLLIMRALDGIEDGKPLTLRIKEEVQ
jgi:hypothetical protein